MSEPLNPVDVENSISEIANRIAKGVAVVSNAYATFLDADRMYDRAFAQAYMAHKGPAHEKRYAAEIETGELRATRDEKDASFRYADRQSKALMEQLRAMQSVGASVRSMYSVAGRS